MARYFYIELQSGTSPGPYDIYHESVSSSNLAIRYDNNEFAENLSYHDLTVIINSETGVPITIPDGATKIIVVNKVNNLNIPYEIILPTPTPTPTPTITVTNTVTPTITATNTVTPTNTPTPTITQTVNCSFGIGVVVLAPSPTVTPTKTSAATSTPTTTPTRTSEATSTPTTTPTRTSAATPTPTTAPTSTPAPTSDPTSTPTSAPTSTPAPTSAATSTPTPTPTLPALSVSVSSTTLQTCWNTNNASFTVSATGGNGAPYEYSRDNSNWQSSATFSSLAGTTYTAYVRNNNRLGTVASTSVSSLARTQPSAGTSSYSYPTCWNSTNGAITMTAEGGSGGYTYSINNGSTYQGSNVFSNLSSDTYYIRVKDSNDCESQSLEQIVLVTNTPNATFTSTNISCNGGSDGSIATAIIDSNGIYYRYNEGAGFTNTSGTRYNVGTSRGSLTADSYTFRIYNSNESCSNDYTITLTQPTLQTASITNVVGATSGDNGSLTISSGGGTFNKIYRLYKDSASPYNDYPTDNLIATYSNVTSGSPSFNITGLACGYYWLQVTDANGCQTNTTTYEVTCPQIYYAYQVIRCDNNSTSTMTSPHLLPSQFTTGGTKAVKINNVCYQIDYYISSTYNQEALHLVDGEYATIYNTCNDCTGGGGGQDI